MENLTRLGWAALAIIHLMPAAVLFKPSLTNTLYGAPTDGDIGILLIHRGALFFAVMVAAIVAILDPASRKLATIITAISLIAFLWIYARAGLPTGSLRKIAIVDGIGLIPLLYVCYQAWLA